MAWCESERHAPGVLGLALRQRSCAAATTGLDNGKNSLHLIGLDGCFGSNLTVKNPGE
jgi:hypothetical protein